MNKSCHRCGRLTPRPDVTEGIRFCGYCIDEMNKYIGVVPTPEKLEIERLQQENKKLRRMIQLDIDMENEDPGCLECSKQKDAAEIANGNTFPTNEGYWHYKQEHVMNPIIDEWNALHTELKL